MSELFCSIATFWAICFESQQIMMRIADAADEWFVLSWYSGQSCPDKCKWKNAAAAHEWSVVILCAICLQQILIKSATCERVSWYSGDCIAVFVEIWSILHCLSLSLCRCVWFASMCLCVHVSVCRVFLCLCVRVCSLANWKTIFLYVCVSMCAHYNCPISHNLACVAWTWGHMFCSMHTSISKGAHYCANSQQRGTGDDYFSLYHRTHRICLTKTDPISFSPILLSPFLLSFFLFLTSLSNRQREHVWVMSPTDVTCLYVWPCMLRWVRDTRSSGVAFQHHHSLGNKFIPINTFPYKGAL